jgi:hypothetical protein
VTVKQKIEIEDKRLKDLLKKVKKQIPTLKVGWVGAPAKTKHAGSEDGLKVGQIAVIHELGLGRNPKRSVIKDWAEQNRQRLTGEYTAATLTAVFREANINLALGRLGAKYVGELQERMVQGIPPPLKEQTIEAKGSALPLINSGQMRAAISYQVSPIKIKDRT